jgi:hypothetical protein
MLNVTASSMSVGLDQGERHPACHGSDGVVRRVGFGSQNRRAAVRCALMMRRSIAFNYYDGYGFWISRRSIFNTSTSGMPERVKAGGSTCCR